jgi:hypothetical protein
MLEDLCAYTPSSEKFKTEVWKTIPLCLMWREMNARIEVLLFGVHFEG